MLEEKDLTIGLYIETQNTNGRLVLKITGIESKILMPHKQDYICELIEGLGNSIFIKLSFITLKHYKIAKDYNRNLKLKELGL